MFDDAKIHFFSDMQDIKKKHQRGWEIILLFMRT